MTAPLFPLEVASGLYVRGDRCLMGLRKPDRQCPNMWETPGGKVDLGEDPRDAAVRELWEELQLRVRIVRYLATAPFQWDRPVSVHLYLVEDCQDEWGHALDQEPTCLDHAELRWVRPAEAMARLPCSPAFYNHYAAILAAMR